MSKVVRDMDRLHQRQVDTLNRRHGREIQRMNEIHEDTVAKIKQGQELDLVNLQEGHQRKIHADQERKERLLMQIKGHLEEQKRLTDKELKELKEYEIQKTAELTDKVTADRDRIIAEHNENIELMNDKFNSQVRRINLEGKDRVDEMNQEQEAQFADRAAYHQKRLDQLQTENSTRYRVNSENHLRLKNDQEKAFKKERMDTYQKHESDLNQMTLQHKELYQKRDHLQRDDLKNQDLFFEKRYAETYKRHNDHIKTLDGIHNKIMKDKQAELAKKIEFRETRTKDPFFQFVELNPTLEHTEQGVRIQVRVPDHAKQDLQLNLNGKEAVVNFNRRYVDNKTDEQGNTSRVSKIETLTSRLQTGVHLDPKSVKSSYQDGVMTYEIKKA